MLPRLAKIAENYPWMAHTGKSAGRAIRGSIPGCPLHLRIESPIRGKEMRKRAEIRGISAP